MVVEALTRSAEDLRIRESLNSTENQTLTASEASGAAFPAGSAFVSNSVCSAEYSGLGVDEGCSDCGGLTDSGSL